MGAGSALLMMVGLSAPTGAMLDARALQESAAASDSSAVSSPMGSSDSAPVDRAATDSTTARKPRKHRSVGGRATHMIKSFASDLGYVATSPLRLEPLGILLAVASLGGTVVTYGYDNEIRRGFVRSRGNALYDDALKVGNDLVDVGFMGKTWPYWVGGAVLGTAVDFDPLQSVCLDVIESHLIAGGMRNAAKFVIGREHPFEAGRSKFFAHGTSMPSGHTSVVFEIATIFTRHTDGWPVPARILVGTASYGIATCVGMQRVDSNAHWASDCVIAAINGSVVANTVVNRNQERRKKEGIAGSPTLVPILDSSGQPAFALVWRF